VRRNSEGFSQIHSISKQNWRRTVKIKARCQFLRQNRRYFPKATYKPIEIPLEALYARLCRFALIYA